MRRDHIARVTQGPVAAARSERHEGRGATPQLGRAPGRPLDQTARSRFEAAYNHAFEDVRVHDDQGANDAAAALGAAAFTVGRDVVFANGAYAPNTPAGKRVLAHELAHVVQYDRFGSPDSGDPVSHPADGAELEAERAAADATEGRAATVTSPPSAVRSRTLGDLWNLVSGKEPSGDREPSFFRDVIAPTVWGGYTDDTIGGLVDFGALKGAPGIGGTFGAVSEGASKVLGPLSLISGGIDMYTGLTSDESNFENTEKIGLGGLNALSGLASTLGLFGVGEGVGAATTIGAGLGAGGAVAAGGQVIGAGLAGYGAGKLLDAGVGLGMRETGLGGLMDRGIDKLLGMTGAGTVMDSVGGGDAAAGHRGDYTLSDIGARAMTGVDQLVTGGMRAAGLYDESKPAYTQTLGWKLAEVLPSWLQ